jgi:hypothetical protein
MGQAMSMEAFVLSDKRLGSVAEWQQAIDAAGFALTLVDDRMVGYLPAQWRDRLTGFECDHRDADEFINQIDDVDFDRRWKHLLAFQLADDNVASLVAYMAAAAYAQATGGIVLDGPSHDLWAPEQALEAARIFEGDLPTIEEMEREAAEELAGIPSRQD